MADTNVLVDTVLPVNLSRQVAQMQRYGLSLDLALAGIPFNLKMSQQNPMMRGLVNNQKQQFDSSAESGEQSFGYWWLRSQASFHGGAGQEYADTGVVDPAISRIRFFESVAIDPFEPGEISVSVPYGYGSAQAGVVYGAAVPVTRGGVHEIALMRTDSANVDFYTVSAGTYSTVSVGTGTPQSIASDGNRVYVAVGDSIVRIDADDSTTTIATLSFSDPVTVGFAKERVILGHGPEIYEVDPNGSSVALGASERIHTHATPDWQWNVIADGPNAIFLAGYSGPMSSVFSVSETDSGGTLVLGPAIEQATMPTGERVQAMLFYVNSLFALGTTAGLRVGTFTPYAQVVWGPASIPDVSITSVTAVGSVVHATSADDKLYRLDLGVQADSAGRYAYVCRADDAPEALIAVVATGDPAAVYVATNNRIGAEDSSQSATGTLTGSWLTWNTTEPKRAHYLTISGDFAGPGGTAEVQTLDGLAQQFSIPAASSQTTLEFGLTGLAASDAFRVLFSLDRDSGDGQTALRSYQIKALPEPRRYQQVVYPLLVEDHELTAGGERIGYPGFAADRINTLETIARRNEVVTVEDALLDQSYQGMIREVQFRQDAGPEQTKPLGGIATVVIGLVA